MIAFEININGECFTIAANNHVLINISRGVAKQDVDNILAFGFDDANTYYWLDEKVCEGNMFYIKVVDVEEDDISIPRTITKKNRKDMLERFEKLEQELIKRNML